MWPKSKSKSKRTFPRWTPDEIRTYYRDLFAVAGPCEIWPGYINSQGYGEKYENGRHLLAHRLAWIKAHGPIPDGILVRHRCDNPPCINPGHLLLGTHMDNMRDAFERGRRGVNPSSYVGRKYVGREPWTYWDRPDGGTIAPSPTGTQLALFEVAA